MDLILVGPGRAGLALSLRLSDSGHSIVGVIARDRAAADIAAARLDSVPLSWEEELPSADLVVVAVRDDAIAPVAERLAPVSSRVESAVHLSGLAPVSALGGLDGPELGSFHPLQTLPDAEVGASMLEGAWGGVTADSDLLADRLFALATSIGMHPFELDDAAKPLYHAAAAAAANYPLAALAISERLFAAAGVPFEAAGPLVAAVVANAMSMGPHDALTGPIVRGDVGTVRAQLAAIEEAAPDLLEHFKAMGRATAAVVSTDAINEVLQ
jgi:predicted short-subunit dehydrogenase-like oxidoreductase (DUF2520 family)